MSIKLVTVTSLAALVAGGALAQEMNFNRIASFPTVFNMAEGEDTSRESSAEIIDATADGMTLVYTDSPLGVIGMIDITDPANPSPMGNIELPGEPTSVAVVGTTAFVGVNTSESYTDPSGMLMALSVPAGDTLASCDLPGQPDSVAKAPDGSFVAVAIENERDEDLNDGIIPQLPGGSLVMVDVVDGSLDCDSLMNVDLAGLADVAPSDPEPEYVSINGEGEVVVTLQENNHMVVVGRDGAILSDFSAGGVDLGAIDTKEEGALLFTDSQPGRLREPDAVTWIDNTHFATANEGDYEGGSRGWTIFSQTGEVIYESGVSFEHAVIQIGHYPEERSGNKGVEPESVTFAEFGGTPFVFVGAERASVVGVYDVTDPAAPVLTQLLPSGIGPEGYVTLPERNLLISANETDDAGPRAHVMVFEYQDAPAVYPHLTSSGMNGLVGWGALSGMVAEGEDTVWAVNDSFYGLQPSIFKIDVTETPARITDVIRINREGYPAQLFDMEGITLDGAGNFYVASEGRLGRGILHALYHITPEGEIAATIPFPKEVLAVERRWAAEGVTKVGDWLWVAIQREFDDDPENHVKLLAYNLETEEWGGVHYRKADPETGWVGLSEITAHGDHVYIVERDNQHDFRAVTKKIYRVALSEMQPAPLTGPLPVVEKEEVVDLLPYLTSTGGYVLDKVEGLAITPGGTMWVSTDNDGVDDHSGETMFFSIDMAN